LMISPVTAVFCTICWGIITGLNLSMFLEYLLDKKH
jgi:hypothetical protein